MCQIFCIFLSFSFVCIADADKILYNAVCIEIWVRSVSILVETLSTHLKEENQMTAFQIPCTLFVCVNCAVAILNLATQKAAVIHHWRTNTTVCVDIFRMLLGKFMQRTHTRCAMQSKHDGEKAFWFQFSVFGFIYCIQITVFKWKWSFFYWYDSRFPTRKKHSVKMNFCQVHAQKSRSNSTVMRAQVRSLLREKEIQVMKQKNKSFVCEVKRRKCERQQTLAD